MKKEKLSESEDQVISVQEKVERARENEEKYKKIAKDIKTKYMMLKESKKEMEEDIKAKEKDYEDKIANLNNDYSHQIQSQLIEINQLKDTSKNLCK